MKEKAVIIEIDEQGNSSIDLEGFRGDGCSEVAKTFQGTDLVRSISHKREFYIQRAPMKLQRERQ